MKRKIVVIGGHLTPALSVILELQKRKKFEIFYIGRKYSLEGDKAYSLEYLVIQKMGIPFFHLISARLQRSFTLYTFLSIFKLLPSYILGLYFLLKIKPHIILSFGGYVSLPICLWASLLRIPIIIHEQTPILGFANRLISRYSRYVCLTWKNTQFTGDIGKEIVTGNPTLFDQHLGKIRDGSLTEFGDTKLPLIYITGGSQGSRFINHLTGEILGRIVAKFRILHQTGIADNERDFLLLTQKRKKLPKIYQGNYKIVKFIDPFQIADLFKEVSFLIGRAGANTVFEMQYAGIPGILIPLPWAADDEQAINAARLVKMDSAILLKQEETDVQKLLGAIDYLSDNIGLFKRKAEAASRYLPQKASGIIVKLIESCL